MIKSIYLKNIMNFRNDNDMSFISAKKRSNDVLSNKYNFGKSEFHINNISVLYGKNNVGKTNLIESINIFLNFISGKASFNEVSKLASRGSKDSSIFEITFLSNCDEFRYGVEFLNGEILDEWLYVKINNASRESLVFDRKEEKFSKILLNASLYRKMTLNDNTAIINKISDFDEEILCNMRNIVTNTLYISSHQDIVLRPDVLKKFVDNREYIDRVELALKSIDADIEKITLDYYDEEYMDLFNKILTSDSANLDDKIKELKKISGRLPQFGYKTETSDVAFGINLKMSDGQEYTIHELSFGTRNYLNMLFSIENLRDEDNATLLIDEIEAGLHFGLLDKLVQYINNACNDTMQVIIATHAPKILDYSFIGNENKILIRKNEDEIEIDYVSNFGLKKEHKPSNRYELDVFNVNPKVI